MDLTYEEMKETREALLDYLDQLLLPQRQELAESALSKITVAIVEFEERTR